MFPSSIQRYYQSFVGSDEDHSLEPIIIFIRHLAQANTQAWEAILGGGTLEFFLHLYITNFVDPLAIDIFHGRSALRAACDTLLDSFSSIQTGFEIISKHQIYILWPTPLPLLLPVDPPVDRLVQRPDFWREMEPAFVILRMESIYNMMVMEDRHDLLGQDSLENIAADLLEFSR